MSQKETKQKPDLLRRAKHVGYCWSHMPPEDDTKFEDFVEYARFQLCMRTHRLMQDPIWENYSDIQILAEYFGWMYSESKEQRDKIEHEIGMNEDMYDWFDRMIEENKEELKQKAEALEDINFDPSSVMGT